MSTPTSVKAATALWTAAVAAGVTETGLVVTEIATDGGLDAGVWVDVGVRSVVFSAAAILILCFAAGRRWARTALAVLLSVIGLASMVVPAAAELADGAALTDALGSGGSLNGAFVAVRLLHIAAVVAATVCMFTPTANAHFRNARPPAPITQTPPEHHS